MVICENCGHESGHVEPPELEFRISDGRTLKYFYDTDPPHPTLDDNGIRIITWHSSYRIGHIHKFKTPEEFLATIAPNVELHSLYLYVHSGAKISMTKFQDRWDSMRVGYIYADPEVCAAEGWDQEKLRNVLEGEVEIYNQYLDGTVYRLEVRGADGKIIDTCGGLYGDLDFQRETARHDYERDGFTLTEVY